MRTGASEPGEFDRNGPGPGPAATHGHDGAADPQVRKLTDSLARLRTRARLLLTGARLSLAAAVFIGAVTTLGLLDYLLRLPWWLRQGHWVVGVGLLVWAALFYIRPALRFAPTLTDLALRIERVSPALRNLLASAVDFSRRSADESRLGRGMAGHVVREAAETWRRAPAAEVLRPRAAALNTFLLCLAAGLCLAIGAAAPSLWSIGAQRALAPWAGAVWPKRTGVIDVTPARVHARGTALPLQAAVIKSNRPWDLTYVAVRFRQVSGDSVSPARRELLTWQRREADIRGIPGGAQMFERLIEPGGDFVEFRFETDDDQTEWRRVRLVEPPAVVNAAVTITPPEYAGAIIAARAADEGMGQAGPQTISLGSGTDDRAVAPPALVGSDVDLSITLSRALPIPESVRSLFQSPDEGEDEGAMVRADGATWRIRWKLVDSVRIPIRLVDEHGISSIDEAVYRFEAVRDRPAAATVTEPAIDRAVLPSAVVNVAGEGRDDIALSWVALEAQVFKPAGAAGGEKSPPGGATAPEGEPVELGRLEATRAQTTLRVTSALDLGPLGLRPGDEVRLTALALDVLAARAPEPAPTRSPVRTLRIISEADLVREIQAQLAEIRQAAIRIEQQQAELQEQVARGESGSVLTRAQGQIGERLVRQSEAVRRLIERVQENAMSDRAPEDLLRQARGTINDAAGASSRASAALDRLRESKAETGAPETGDEAAPPSPTGQGAHEPAPRREGAEGSREAAGGQPRAGETQGAQGAQDQATQGGTPSEGGEPGRSTPTPEGAQQPEAGEAQANEEERQASAQAQEAQEEVRERLRSLIELLDRGEDNWVVRHGVERLLREQRDLKEQTQRAGQTTSGKSVEQLTAQERSELERIVEQQNALADAARKLTEDMRQREERLREADPTAAAGMSQAARRAEQENVPQTMRNAAEQAQQNQTSQASRQQQEAIESLEEMLQDLAAADRARDEVLRRMLASIIESLQGLILQQEGELAALDQADRGGVGLSGLDAGMIRLHQNTLGVIEIARAGGGELTPVATLVSRAGEAQSFAITELRRPLLGSRAVREHEHRSLTLLRQALEKAKELDQQAEQRQRDKRLAELLRAYLKALEEQVGLRHETEPLARAVELTRRDRALARGLAQRQEALRLELAALPSKTTELSQAGVFRFAHERLDSMARRSSESLEQGEPKDALAAEQGVIAGIMALIEALKDPRPDDSRFSEAPQSEQGGGGGGGSGPRPLIPPVKELKLLRQMQIDLAGRTVELNNAEKAPPRADLQELARLQRELMRVGNELLDRAMNQAGGQPMGPEAEPGADPEEPPPPPEEPEEDPS